MASSSARPARFWSCSGSPGRLRDFFAGTVGEGRVAEEDFEGNRADADHEFVGAEGFCIEEHAGVHAAGLVVFRVLRTLDEGRNVQTQGFQQSCCDRAIRTRAVDLQRAAVHEMQMTIEVEFVALGVAAEIIVVVQDQYAAFRCLGPIEVGRRQAADAPADDDQIVFLAGIGRRRPGLAVSERMSAFEGSGMAAAHAGEKRGIVAQGILGSAGQRRYAGAGQWGGKQGCRWAAVAPIAMPFRKSRRLMGRSMPRARSLGFFLRWFVMYSLKFGARRLFFWIRQVTLPGGPLASPSILYIMTVTVYIYR